MSNDVMNESFFANKQVPMCEKTGLISLMLGGTNEKNALGYNGQDRSFVSLVCDRRGMKTPVAFTYGHPESLSEMACKTLLHNMGIDRVVAVDKLFDGSMTDEDVVKKLEEHYHGNPNIDKTKFSENFDSLRLPNIKYYMEQLKNTDSYLADNPKILEGVLKTAEEICGKKKQPMTNNKE